MAVRTVLQQADLERALTRIAHEILEANRGADDLILLGIPTRGVVLAERLARIISRIAGVDVPAGSLDVTMYRDDLGRNPIRATHPTEVPGDGIDGRVVVLVDRGHREFPIRADYVGKNLPSSTRERINVHLAEVDGDDAVTIEGGDE